MIMDLRHRLGVIGVNLAEGCTKFQRVLHKARPIVQTIHLPLRLHLHFTLTGKAAKKHSHSVIPSFSLSHPTESKSLESCTILPDSGTVSYLLLNRPLSYAKDGVPIYQPTSMLPLHFDLFFNRTYAVVVTQ